MITFLLTLAFQIPPIVAVTPTSTSTFKEPQVAVENDGHVYIAYGAGNTVFISVSSDKGKTFGSPIKVAEAGTISLGMRRGPRIAAQNGKVTITAVYGQKGKGADGDIVTFRSENHGETWTSGAKVNDVQGAAREGLHAMAIAPNGTLACTWLDLRSKGTTLYLSTSKDSGKSWSKNRLAYESPSGSICECCHPSLAYDPYGRLFVMFRNSLDGARDMWGMFTNNGVEFSKPTKIGKESWIINACPMDGGMITVDSKGKATAIWRRESSVYSTSLANEETLAGPGQQPWGAFGDDGLYMVWMGPKGIMSKTPGKAGLLVSGLGTDPVVASSPDHKIVVAAWTENGIKASRLAK